MIWEGYSKVRQLEKLGDGGGGGWSVFVNIKDWQGQSKSSKVSQYFYLIDLFCVSFHIGRGSASELPSPTSVSAQDTSSIT